MTRNPADAEELVQETFRRALGARNPPHTMDLENLRPWAFTILRNVWLSSLQRTRDTVHLDTVAHALPARLDSSPELLVRRRLLRSEIAQAIDSLPEPQREAVVLRDVEGLSYAEMASILGCPAGTVMSRLARARQMLRALLTHHAPVSATEARA